MKKMNWFLWTLLLLIAPTLQSCDDDEGYSIGDFSWDWATVRTVGSGSYFLEGDRWGTIWPAATAIPNFKPVDGERIVAYFNPLYDDFQGYDVAVKMESVRPVLTKTVETLTPENEAEYGNDPIVIYQGDMWLGGHYLNLVFQQQVPMEKKHRISLVENSTDTYGEDGYVHLELRYNTYDDTTSYWQLSPVSFNLLPFYPSESENAVLKGFKIKINSKTNGERVLVLDLNQPVARPENGNNISAESHLK